MKIGELRLLGKLTDILNNKTTYLLSKEVSEENETAWRNVKNESG